MKATGIKKCTLCLAVFFVITAALFVSAYSVFASDDISAKVSYIDIDAAKMEYEFHIDIKGIPQGQSANVAVVSYDIDGTCRQKTIVPATEDSARLPFDSQATNYKVMLLDGTNLLKPLCQPETGALETWNYSQKITVMSENIENFDEDTLELSYYADYNSISKHTIKLKKTNSGILYNESVALSFSSFSDIIANSDVILEFEDTDSDMMYDKISATQYTYAIVDEVQLERNRINLKYTSSLYIPEEDEGVTTVLIDSSGREITFDDIASGDVLAIATDYDTTRYVYYLKIVKVTDSKVKGTVDKTHVSKYGDHIVIGDKDYIDISGQDIRTGDAGIFYIGLTGKVFCYDIDYDALNYAYVLEGGFTNDVWNFTLLTENGDVTTYEVADNMSAEDYVYENSDAFTLSGNEFAFENATDREKKHEARFITYTVDSQGKINVEIPEFGSLYKISKDSMTYNSSNNTIGTYRLKNQLTVFDVSGGVDEAFVTDQSHLRDFVGYSGLVFANPTENLHSVVVITDTKDFNLEVSESFAIVTKVSGEQITFLQDQREDTITVADAIIGNASKELPKVGDVFLYSDDGDKNAEMILVIATIDEDTNDFSLTAEADTGDEVHELWNKNTELVIGYISDTDITSFGKGYMFEVSTPAYTDMFVLKTANMYMYDHMVDTDKIFTITRPDSAYEDRETGKIIGFPILVRLVGGDGVELYTTTGEFVIE